MKNVKKQILPKYFRDVSMGIKTFELRKDEDDIQPGDVLDLLEWEDDEYTGRNMRCVVTYVLRDCPEYGLMEGYCIIGIEAVGEVVATENYAEYYAPSKESRKAAKSRLEDGINPSDKSLDDFRDERLTAKYPEKSNMMTGNRLSPV